MGHHAIHVGDAMLRKGLIKCSILPPKRLYHPVLTFRCNNKLLFCLCKSCATEKITDSECAHETVAERALIGRWFVDEVRLAMQRVMSSMRFLRCTNTSSQNRIRKRFRVVSFRVYKYIFEIEDRG